jgi:hypothetical protein
MVTPYRAAPAATTVTSDVASSGTQQGVINDKPLRNAEEAPCPVVAGPGCRQIARRRHIPTKRVITAAAVAQNPVTFGLLSQAVLALPQAAVIVEFTCIPWRRAYSSMRGSPTVVLSVRTRRRTRDRFDKQFPVRLDGTPKSTHRSTAVHFSMATP